MEKITIVIPTLWRVPKFRKMLPVYLESPDVAEVIIIDNDPENTFDLDPHPKLRMLTKGHNIFINPAWNWGVKEAKTHLVALVNDDIVIGRMEFQYMINVGRLNINTDKYGIIGIDSDCFDPEDKMHGIVKVRQMVERPDGYGVFLFTSKSTYTPIPEDLVLWMGDDIQYYTNKAGKLGGVYIETKMSETIGSEKSISDRAWKDKDIYEEKYKDRYEPRIMHQDLINMLITENNYESYLEIGVRNKADCFDLINCERKVGVDPNPEALAEYVMTSDQFFEQNHGLTFDIVFIDGSHIAVDVWKDILNSLGVLNPGGAVVMHDCSPPTEFSQREDHMSGDWHGSVWKAFVRFRKSGLATKYKTFCVDSDWGLGVILDYDPDTWAVEGEVTYDYESLDANRAQWLGLVRPGAVEKMIKC